MTSVSCTQVVFMELVVNHGIATVSHNGVDFFVTQVTTASVLWAYFVVSTGQPICMRKCAFCLS